MTSLTLLKSMIIGEFCDFSVSGTVIGPRITELK